jgi:hypothetical protein
LLLAILLLAGCGGQVQVSVSTLTPASGQTAVASPTAATSAPLAPTTAPPVATTAAVAPTGEPTAVKPVTAIPSVIVQPGLGEIEIRQWAVSATASSEYNNPAWAASQATGAPDTPQCDDVETAWASGTAGGVEWLELRYATPVRPTGLNVYQSYSPGQVVRIDLLDTAGNYHTVYTSEPRELPSCPNVLAVPVEANYQALAVRLTVDQTTRNDWTEIDAVELVGWASASGAPAPTSAPAGAPQEIRQWGNSAQAGSEYGSSDYSASQAAGPPNTLTCGDLATAWASAQSDAIDWLEVRYATPVRPTQVQIVQSYNPGAVVRVELLDTAGTYHEIYTAQPALEAICPATLSVDVPDASYQAIAVRITVDQSARGDWAEIDAVELVGWTG